MDFRRASSIQGTIYTKLMGGKIQQCEREQHKAKDGYAVSVNKCGIIVKHLPKNICFLLLKRGGTITCEVAGSRQHFSDLHQGGLEVPCELLFTVIYISIFSISNSLSLNSSSILCSSS